MEHHGYVNLVFHSSEKFWWSRDCTRDRPHHRMTNMKRPSSLSGACNHKPDDHKLMSFDVKSLFTSIPLQLALHCTENAIKNSTVELPLPTDDIIYLFNLCLTWSVFSSKHWPVSLNSNKENSFAPPSLTEKLRNVFHSTCLLNWSHLSFSLFV